MMKVFYAESNYFRSSAGRTDRSSRSTGQRRLGCGQDPCLPDVYRILRFEHGHKTGFLGHEGAGEVVEARNRVGS